MGEFETKVMEASYTAFTEGFYKTDDVIEKLGFIDFIESVDENTILKEKVFYLCEQLVSANENAEGAGRIFICEKPDIDIEAMVEERGLKNQTVEFVCTYLQNGEYYVDLYKVVIEDKITNIGYEKRHIGKYLYLVPCIQGLLNQ